MLASCALPFLGYLLDMGNREVEDVETAYCEILLIVKEKIFRYSKRYPLRLGLDEMKKSENLYSVLIPHLWSFY